MVKRTSSLSILFLSLAAALATTLATAHLEARTYPTSDYKNDPASKSSHVFGVYKPVKGVYSDPNFEEALSISSPLNEQKYESYDAVIIVNIDGSVDPVTQVPIRAQTLRTYVRPQAITRIGAELFDETSYDQNTGLLFYWKISTARAGKATPRGYYRPESFSSDHRSSIYNDALMPWAVFFNGNIATHGIFGDSIAKLGTPASAGCVRVEPQRAKDLFYLMGLTGKGWVDVIDKDGNLGHTANGEILQETNWKTLISVQ